MNERVVLILLYLISSVVLSLYVVLSFSKTRKLTGIFLVRGMYCLIYAYVPCITHYYTYVYGLDSKTYSFDYSDAGIAVFYKMFFYSIIGFLALELGYHSRIIKIRESNSIINREIDNSAIRTAAVIMIIISAFSLLMWTREFGGPIKFLSYASAIRSGLINNSNGFYKHFVPLSQFATICGIATLVRYRRVKDFLITVFAGIISGFYLIANDGRAPFAIYLVSILVLISILHSKNSTVHVRVKLVYIMLLFALGIVIITTFDNTFHLTGGDEKQSIASFINPFKIIYPEFSWTVRNAQAVHEAMQSGENTWRLGKELLSGIFGVLPSKFRPDSIVRLEKINTQYWVAGLHSYSGGKPPDMLTAGLYVLSYFGIFILPFTYGRIIRRLDKFFAEHNVGLYYKILFVQMLYQIMKTVAYCDFALVTQNLFYIVVGHIIIRVCNMFTSANSSSLKVRR